MSAIPRAFTILGQGQGGTYLFADGTAAAPSISFLSDSDTGFYRNASNQFAVTLGGTFAFYFASGGYLYGSQGANSLFLGTSGSVALTAAGTNQNITLTPSGTGLVDISSARVASGVVKVRSTSASGYSSYDNYDDADTQMAGFGYGNASAGNAQLAGRAYVWTNSRNFSFVNGSTNIFTAQTNGRFLLGTGNVDSGALLQVGTNTTTSAGGMVFGTDVFLYRHGTNGVSLDLGSGANAALILKSGSGSYVGAFQVDSTNVYIDSQKAGSGLVLRTNGTTTALTLDSSQICTHAAGVVFSTVNTQTAATYSIAATDNYIICNRAGTITLTLGTATNGRRLVVRTITANTVVSASSNVVPVAGGAAGTAILAATAGKWAELVGDGTNWQIQMSN